MSKEQKTTNFASSHFFRISIIVIIVTAIAVCLSTATSPTNTTRDIQAEFLSARKWAEQIELPGLPNFHKVSDNLYRGAQPTEEGIQQLKKLSIKTVINLSSLHSDRGKIADSNFVYEHIYMKPWHPEDKQVIHFLKIVTDKSKLPVFVHCQRGADRTGTMCAVYRVVVQGWTKKQAIQEMTKGGFAFRSIWKNLVKYIKDLDTEKIKHAAIPQKTILPTKSKFKTKTGEIDKK